MGIGPESAAMKYYRTTEGHVVAIPSRRERRREWRADRAAMRLSDREAGLNRIEATIRWRSSWKALRGDL